MSPDHTLLRLDDDQERDPRFLSALLESVADAVIAVDAEYRVVYFGRGAERLYRIPRAEAAGRALIELYRYEWLEPDAEARALRALADTGTWRGENVHVLRDGTRLAVESTVTLLRDAQGRRAGMLAVMRDRTAQRAAEERAAREGRHFRQLVESLPVLMARYDPALSRVVLNRAFVDALGWSDEDVADDDIMTLCYPDPAVRRATAEFMAQPGSGWRVIPTRAKDGRTLRVMWSNVQLSPELQVGVGVDVTALEAATARAEEAERRLEALAQSVPQIVWSTDASGATDYVNVRWYEYTGFAETSAFGEGWTAATHPDERASMLDAWRIAYAAGSPFEKQQRLRGRDGTYRWFLSRGVPVRDANGAVTAWFGSCTDIEEVKRAEAVLREEDRRKDEFIATLSHELRNPLAPLRNGLRLARHASEHDPQLQSVVAMMERQLNHLVRLVDDLLDVGRIRAGKIVLQRGPLRLADAVARGIESTRASIAQQGLTLDTEFGVEDAYVDGDLERLAQVFTNLLSNAAKYTEPGGRVLVRLESDAREARVSVADTGIGIPPDELPRVFELFSQVRAHGVRAQGGLGIGLAIVRQIVAMHGGTVHAASDGPGRGSCFTVCLPRLAAPAPADAAAGTAGA